MYMKNKIKVMVLSGLLIGGTVIMMWLKENIGYILCWCIVVAMLSFMWLPEIKSLTTKWFSVTRKLTEVEVQYKEFKETIYPLLEITLGQTDSAGYLNIGPKSEILADFVTRVEILIKSGRYDNVRLIPLLDGAKGQTLSTFGSELNIITKEVEGLPKPSSYIHTGLISDYSKKGYLDNDNVYVDFEGLKEIGSKMPNGVQKKRYEDRLSELTEFYNNNF
ncbi:hypothetical protein DKZ32_02550 [Limosilactobacillus reuteri]|nr:hypothetical protein DKZ33_02565 [Limosilactobacillus reuteri]PWT63723.1 hypothetical protein DKZ32_02550 [Limosilactobacillus reuteri]